MNKRAFVQLIQLSFVGKSSGFFFRLEIGNPASFKFPVSGLIMCECFWLSSQLVSVAGDGRILVWQLNSRHKQLSLTEGSVPHSKCAPRATLFSRRDSGKV